MTQEPLSEAERLTLELENRKGELESEGYREPEISLLTFYLSNEWFAIPLDNVKVVSRMLEVTPIPGASPYVLGVINYKSTIYPLIDLHQLLELRPSMPTRATRVVIINHERDPFAVLVDSTTEVREVRYSELTQRVESNQDVTQFVSTEINMSGKLLGVLNVEVIYLMIAGERPAGLGVL